MDRIARSEPGEDREKVIDAFVFAHLAYQAIGMNIVEGKELFRPLEPAIGGAEPLRMTDPGPASARQGSQFEGAALVEADDRSVLRTALAEVEDGVCFTSNSGSGDAFHVLVC